MGSPVFKIHTLGCGSAKPTLRHLPSCTVLDFQNTLHMIDCGEGAQLEFLKRGLKPGRLSHILLTHLHGDHVLGLPGLLSSLSLSKHTSPLTIHTFAEGKEMIESFMDFFGHPDTFRLNYNIIQPADDIIYETPRLRIKSVKLDHRVNAVGYIFEEKKRLRTLLPKECSKYEIPVSAYRAIKEGADFIMPDGRILLNESLTLPPDNPLTYAHIADTAYMPDLAERIGRPDLMYHETTYLDAEAPLAVARGHSTARQAAQVAKDCDARYLLTGHYSSRYSDDEVFLREATSIFPNTILNKEGITIDIAAL